LSGRIKRPRTKDDDNDDNDDQDDWGIPGNSARGKEEVLAENDTARISKLAASFLRFPVIS